MVVASAAGPGLAWQQAIRYLPSIDTPDMRDWLDRQAVGRDGAVVMPVAEGSGLPAVPHREVCVPPHEFAVFAIAVTDQAMATAALGDPQLRPDTDGASPQRRAGLDLAPTADCAQRARRFVDQVCDDWGLPWMIGPARLVATELVENAYLHAHSDDDIGLRLELRDRDLTIAVTDADSYPATLHAADPRRTAAYGLHLVDHLAAAWGCTRQWQGGKVVWAGLPTRADA
ncbi:ATP-binding protein [Nocardia inohanensis]|uniref:ATP-binding protein n=1 Tax=Nocardia inohanensis TaxID=209246 RepID=UPI0012F91ED0|nr:ATP-binding protein [Nocardia inohanensis]